MDSGATVFDAMEPPKEPWHLEWDDSKVLL